MCIENNQNIFFIDTLFVLYLYSNKNIKKNQLLIKKACARE